MRFDQEKRLAVAMKRQMHGECKLERAGCLGDIVTYSHAQLLLRETAIDIEKFDYLMQQPIRPGDKYVIKSFSPSMIEYPVISIWIEQKDSIGMNYAAMRNERLLTIHDVMEPKWWEIEDDVTVGDQPIYVEPVEV